MAFNWNIVQPTARTNFFLNPSFEKWTAGAPDNWADYAGPTTTQDSTRTWRGAYSCKLVSASGFRGKYQDVAGTNGQSYTVSAWVYVEAGQMALIAYDYGGTANGVAQASTGTGWQRLTVTKVAAGGGARVHLVSNNQAATFYVDAVQFELGAVTTYLDGDEPGCYWTGTPHASTSVRDGQSREGGTLVPLTNYFRKVLKAPGAGVPMFNNISLPFGLVGGEIYQRSIKQARQFIIRGAVDASPASNTYHAKRRQLFDLLKADAVTPTQPVKLRYDDGGVPALEIKAVYNGGMEITDFDGWWETVDLGFTAHDPLFYSEQESAQVLGYQTTVADGNMLLIRDTTGLWASYGTWANGQISAIAVGPDGSIYLGGDFTSIGGVANTAYIAKWNGVTFSALGTGMNGAVQALAFDAAGNLYAGGDFTLAGGVANTIRVAKWNGSAWSALSTGANGTVVGVAVGLDGSVYIGGGFTAPAAGVAKWNGAAWSGLGTGLPGGFSTTKIRIAPNGYLFVGHNNSGSTGIGGVSGTPYCAYWNGSAWKSISGGADGTVNDFAFGADGSVYVVGSFSNVGSIAAARVAKWNYVSWSPLGTGLTGGLSCGAVTIGPDGNVYFAGSFTTAGGLTLPAPIAVWNGSSFSTPDINLNGASSNALAFDNIGRFYIAINGATSSIKSANINTTVNASTKTYPRFILTGPGKIWHIQNFTTGRKIYFNNLTLLSGEVLTLRLQQGNVTFVSNWRGNMLPYILQGSNMDWYLSPGNNTVSAYMSGSTPAANPVMLWRNAYWSSDGVE